MIPSVACEWRLPAATERGRVWWLSCSVSRCPGEMWAVRVLAPRETSRHATSGHGTRGRSRAMMWANAWGHDELSIYSTEYHELKPPHWRMTLQADQQGTCRLWQGNFFKSLRLPLAVLVTLGGSEALLATHPMATSTPATFIMSPTKGVTQFLRACFMFFPPPGRSACTGCPPNPT